MSKSLIINRKTQIIKNSDYMKIVIASLYRFVLNYKYTTTEFDLKDVCACNKNYSVEIECKISKSDLKNELKSKTKIKKHNAYANPTKKYYHWIPNRFYYAITDEMAQDPEIFDIINQINPKYGIFICSDWGNPREFKVAKKLHNEKVSQAFIEELVARCSSENINLRKDNYILKQKNNAE